jgi:tetratricopeptide (TPR) repeat protein
LKNNLFLILICILFFSCKKENTFLLKEKNIDSLLNEAEKSQDYKFKLNVADSIYSILKFDSNDSVSRKRHLNLSYLYQSIKNPKYVNICYELLKKNKLLKVREIAYCNNALGNYYYDISNYEKAYYFLKIAEKNYKKLDDDLLVSYVSITKANILTFKKDFVEAEKLAIRSLKIAKSENDVLLEYNCYITLGNSQSGLQYYDKAFEYYQKAYEICEDFKLDSNYLHNKIQALNYTALVKQKQKQFNESLFFSKATNRL